MPKLSEQQIGQELQSLPGWEHSDNTICKLYRFKEFMDGISFIGQVA